MSACDSKCSPRVKTVDRKQMLLHAVDVDQLIEEAHPARSIWELVGRLNLNSFYDCICVFEGEAGRTAFDPQLLISMQAIEHIERLARRAGDDARAKHGILIRSVRVHGDGPLVVAEIARIVGGEQRAFLDSKALAVRRGGDAFSPDTADRELMMKIHIVLYAGISRNNRAFRQVLTGSLLEEGQNWRS